MFVPPMPDPEVTGSLQALRPEDRVLPVEHLQAGVVTEELFRRAEIHTVGALADVLAAHDSTYESTMPLLGQFRDIRANLAACLMRDGGIDWDLYRQRAKRVRNLALTSRNLERMSRQERGLSVAMLHIRHAHKVLLAENIKTIGDLLAQARKGITSQEMNSSQVRQEILRALAALSAVTDEAGNVDWLAYAAQMGVALLPETLTPEQPQAGYVVLTSPRLDTLSATVRSQDLAVMRMRRAHRPLMVENIRTIGDLVDRARIGVRGVGLRAGAVKTEIFRALTALAASAGEDGEVDWTAYFSRIGIPLISNSLDSDANLEDPLAQLPLLCHQILLHSKAKSERDWLIFQKRFLCTPDRRTTLEGLAEIFGVSRERVRQVQETLVQTIRDQLLGLDLSPASLAMVPKTTEPWRAAELALATCTDGCWLKSRWLDTLCQTWGVAKANVEKNILLICAILGYQELRPDHEELEAIMLDERRSRLDAAAIRTTVDAIHDAVTESDARHDSVDLLRSVKKRFPKGQGPTLQHIPQLASLCSTVEAVGDAHYQSKFVALRRREDQVVRILEERGTPMDLRDIVREINKRVVTSRGRALQSRSLVGRLSDDERIVPIGKTGNWALACWGNETRTIADLVEACLHQTGEALNEDAIWERIGTLRPMARNSVPLILRSAGRFRRLGPRSWALKQWGDFTSNDWGTSDRVGRFVEEFFRALGAPRVNFGDLRTALMFESGMSARTAQGALSHHRAIMVERPDARTRIAVFQAGWRTAAEPVRVRRRRAATGKMEKLGESVRAKLLAAPTRELLLSQLVKELEKEFKVPRPTVYAVVSRSKDVETYQIQPGGPKLCRLVKASDRRVGPSLVLAREERLRGLLQVMFTHEELTHALRAWPTTKDLLKFLPGASATPVGFTWEVVLLLQREGLISELWPRLYQERPGRQAEIREVQRLFED